MNEQQRLQEAINRGIQTNVPSRAWESTVAIVVAHPPAVSQLGSGTLFQVADRHFLVTASHVIRLAHKHRKTIGIAATGNDNLIAVAGNWMCSTPSEGPGIDPHDPDNADAFDVAVHLLPDETVAKLRSMRFLRIGDVYFSDPGPKAVYTLFGYPGVWSEPTRTSEERLIVKPLEFTTYAYDGDVAELRGFKPQLHLLLSAGPEYLTAPDGSKMEFSSVLEVRRITVLAEQALYVPADVRTRRIAVHPIDRDVALDDRHELMRDDA